MLAVALDVEDINIGKPLEEHRLPLHHRLAREGPNVTQSQHRGAIAEHGPQISTARVFVSILRIFLDFETRHRYAGCVGQAQIALGPAGLGGSNFNLSGTRPQMIVERLLLADRHDILRTISIRGALLGIGGKSPSLE